ncbi:hypothetical protein ACWT_3878 [Actinoplanes sp. SE50]|uniref:hypothetical protein n=1 Tax=unclassified Actinoplanes TaxID=2626549 RepID=UPI00023ED084|nr:MULTISPECIES: hypothetical protein [unclassified Actinoplanes]AEV84902.1 hypothetical protein ACPL_4007 [Actinoplanes sp. SE50/110]ATO83293.1 hypothetical protein ACWT_3878 [Actinoplanes sp. SE50]SLM00700.1 uncharacterized protein ACSP50_3933 [Actinoplanes sp. SE50/110]
MKRILVVIPLLAGLTGCVSPAEAAKPPVCNSWAAVQQTVGHIREVNVSANGLSALRPYLIQLKTELTQFFADAKAQFGADGEALKASVEQLGADLRTARADPTVANLSVVRTSVSGVRDDANRLHDTMLSTC